MNPVGENAPRVGSAPSGSAVRYRSAYVGLLLFTLVLYVRPNDFLPIGDFPVAKIVGVGALLAFLLESLSAEGFVGPLPREQKYLFGLLGTMCLAVPLALDRAQAIDVIFGLYLKVVLVFLIMVSVITSEARLRQLIGLTVLCGTGTALGTLRNFLAGEELVAGYRATGVLEGMFGNPNDLALALNMLIPLAAGLALTCRTLAPRILYLGSAAVMVAVIYVTFSRSGLLAFLAMILYLLATVGRRSQGMAILLAGAIITFLFFAPENYGSRMGSILDSSLDASGSSGERWDLLTRSIELVVSNPKVVAVGIGAGNFQVLSDQGKGNHNAYLQVFTELGLPGLILYLLFLTRTFRDLAGVIGSGRRDHSSSGHMVIAVAIRASLIAFFVGSFFADVAYQWYLYYTAAYAVCLRRMVGTQGLSGEAKRMARREGPSLACERSSVA